jgi:hypothetical protein
MLQQVDSATARDAMQHAASVLSAVFVAEKVDAFFYDASEEMLVALGTSDTPLGKRQHELGLNRLPLSSGGRTAWVFREQRPHRDGHVQKDELELPGIRRDLGIRSTIAAPIQVGAGPRGVLVASSQQPDQFTEDQLHLLHSWPTGSAWSRVTMQRRNSQVCRLSPRVAHTARSKRMQRRRRTRRRRHSRTSRPNWLSGVRRRRRRAGLSCCHFRRWLFDWSNSTPPDRQ